MALENFTTYTETDPGADISVTATRVTTTSMTEEIDAHIYIDKGVNYFAGNFKIDVTVYRSVNSGGFISLATLANLIDDWKAIDTANGDGVCIRFGQTSTTYDLYLLELDGGTEYASSIYNFTLSTLYYLTFRRDETVGTYGTLYLDIYSDVGRATLLQTLSLTLHTSKKDFRYLYALQSVGSGNQAFTTGYVEAMEITSNVSNPAVTTQSCTAILTTTATGNGTITNIGSSSVTEHGHCWATTVNPTTANSKTTNGAGSLGAFTSSITGLTAGIGYYVRAYATNSAGTAYGANVFFRAGLPQSQRPPLEIGIKDNEIRFIGEDGVEYKLTGTAI